MGYPDTAEGFAISDHAKWQEFKKQEFKLKTFEEDDIDIAIECCGVCGSDVHTITGGWGESDKLPLVVGHEVIGKAVRVGNKVKGLKVGDRCGLGAQAGADLDCKICVSGWENYCASAIDTYGAPYKDGIVSQGGYSSYIRAHQYFVFPIPDSIPSELAAPLMCAGLTTYAPLVELGAGPGKKVGIVGLGGLGHYAVMFSKALGAETFVLSHSPSKKEDALKLGADHFIDTTQSGWEEPYAFTFDFLLNTADMTHKFDIPKYLGTLKVMGRFHQVGLPDEPLSIMVQDFSANNSSIGTSHIGNRSEMLAMLDLVAKQNLKSWIETIQISEEGCKEAVTRVHNNDNVRYRLVLTGFDKAFGKRSD